MYVIGKSNKTYTLWDMETVNRLSNNGKPIIEYRYSYIQSLSSNLSEVSAKYPDAAIDETIRGHRGFSKYGFPEHAADEFPKGKYAGQKIYNCVDMSYLTWAITSILSEEGIKLAEEVLHDNGYRKIDDEHWASPEQLQKIEANDDECRRITALIDNHEEISLSVERNLNYIGELHIGKLIYAFPNYKTMQYEEYFYALPEDDKGNAKRIKGKTLSLNASKYEIINCENGSNKVKVLIDNFRIIK